MLARIGKLYRSFGLGVGGLVGILAFLAIWIFLIARFGLVFGTALGWIPAALGAMVVSVAVSWLWLPLVLAMALVVAAPAWDKGGLVKTATTRASAYTVRGWTKTEAWIRHAAGWTKTQAQREGLIKPER
jgi:hypothetical protein